MLKMRCVRYIVLYCNATISYNWCVIEGTLCPPLEQKKH